LPKRGADAMIARMLDLAEIDRQLAELGTPSESPASLVERNLGTDRSLERIDAMLATLAENTAPIEAAPARARVPSEPPRALARHARWAPKKEASDAGARPANARDTLIGPVATSPEPLVTAAPVAEPNELTQPRFTDERDETTTSVRLAPENGSLAVVHERRAQMKALLDADIDPSDFPSAPPPSETKPVDNATHAAPAEEDELELLIEDEELLEIADDDLEIVEDEES
jgi:hypothetical protein